MQNDPAPSDVPVSSGGEPEAPVRMPDAPMTAGALVGLLIACGSILFVVPLAMLLGVDFRTIVAVGFAVLVALFVISFIMIRRALKRRSPGGGA